MAPPLDMASAGWIGALTGTGPERDAGLARLHGMLVRVAVRELRRRAASSGITGPELDDLAYQAAADAMLAIIAKLDTFRAESRFTTWAYRFVVLEVAGKLGRHFWRQHPAASLHAEDWESPPCRQLSRRGALAYQSRRQHSACLVSGHDEPMSYLRGPNLCLAWPADPGAVAGTVGRAARR